MIVTFASRKGGSGKSTLATNIATARKKAGFDVCLGDLDDQRSSETWAAVRAQNQIDPYIPVTCASGKGVMQAMQAQATKYQDLILDVPGRDAIAPAGAAPVTVELGERPPPLESPAYRRTT